MCSIMRIIRKKWSDKNKELQEKLKPGKIEVNDAAVSEAVVESWCKKCKPFAALPISSGFFREESCKKQAEMVRLT